MSRIDRDTEIRLFRDLLAGKDEQRVRDAILASQMRNIKVIATQFSRRYPTKSFDDFAQEGVIAVLHAIHNFDPDMGFRFSTYVEPWIKQACQREVFRSFPIRLSETRFREADRNEREAQRQLAAFGTVKLELEERRLPQFVTMDTCEVSDHGQLEKDVIEDRTLDVVWKEVERLPSFQRKLMLQHYRDRKTHQEIADEIGLTRQRVGQILATAAETIRGRCKV